MTAMKTFRQISGNSRAERRGVAAAEFAVLCPLFLMMVLGTWELGTALTNGTIIAAAVREGGRLAAMDFEPTLKNGETANQKIARDIKAFLSASGIPGDKVTVSITHASGPDEGDTFDLQDPDNYLGLFRVSASVAYEDVSVFPLKYMAEQTLSASMVFKQGRRVGSVN
jgi:Flp pilus assembly protein TadG